MDITQGLRQNIGGTGKMQLNGNLLLEEQHMMFLENLAMESIILLRRVNPFPPSMPIWHRLAKLSILILEGIIKKISYERRDYESVDEKSLS